MDADFGLTLFLSSWTPGVADRILNGGDTVFDTLRLDGGSIHTGWKPEL